MAGQNTVSSGRIGLESCRRRCSADSYNPDGQGILLCHLSYGHISGCRGVGAQGQEEENEKMVQLVPREEGSQIRSFRNISDCIDCRCQCVCSFACPIQFIRTDSSESFPTRMDLGEQCVCIHSRKVRFLRIRA